jgi:hypothetical protein
MALLNYVASRTTTRHPAVTTLIFGGIGFAVGFLLSLIVASYSLYVCTIL